MDTIDLALLADALPDTHKPLRGRIRAALDAYSARTDVRVAADHANHAVQYIDTAPPLPQNAVEDVVMALTTSAVIYYARATKSKSDHRATFDIRPRFDEREREEHELICALRDGAIAHYGPGPIGERLCLRSDHILLPPPWTNLVMVSRHLYGTTSFARRLSRQAARATLILQRLCEEKEIVLIEALNSSVEDPTFQTAKEKAVVDLGEAIGDPSMAESILTGPRAGHVRLSTGEAPPIPHNGSAMRAAPPRAR